MAIPDFVGRGNGIVVAVLFKALQMGDMARVAPVDKLSVVFVICLSFLFLKEPVNAKVIVGALLITAGSIVML